MSKPLRLRSTRIAPGYYRVLYGDEVFYVTKVEGHKAWYWRPEDGKAEDWYPTKWLAMAALEAWVTEERYGYQ